MPKPRVRVIHTGIYRYLVQLELLVSAMHARAIENEDPYLFDQTDQFSRVLNGAEESLRKDLALQMKHELRLQLRQLRNEGGIA